VSKIVTGHNADDIAETVIMNILRFTEKLLPKLIEICFIEVKMKQIVLLLRILRPFSLKGTGSPVGLSYG
jgi:tRNA(Ile)-lysidine synthase TilS/MesJ